MDLKELIKMEYHGKKWYALIQKKHLTEFAEIGGVIDANHGGLILGQSHTEGGIYLLSDWDQTRYCAHANVEGWEYLVNHLALAKYLEELKEINNIERDAKEEFTPYDVPEGVPIIDASPIEDKGVLCTKFLIVNGQNFVVNKHSTKKYLMEINQLNSIESSH